MAMFLLCNRENCNERFSASTHFVKHLHKDHFLRDNPLLKLICPQCSNILTTFNGYSKHLKKHSWATFASEQDPSPVIKTVFEAGNNSSLARVQSESNMSCAENSNISMTEDVNISENNCNNLSQDDENPKPSMKLQTFDFSAELLSLGLPVTTINFVMKKVRDLTETFSENVDKTMENSLKAIISKAEETICKDLEKLTVSENFPIEFNQFKETISSNLKDVNLIVKNTLSGEVSALPYYFRLFDSEYKRNKFLASICTLPSVQELTLRSDIEMGVTKTGKHGHVLKTRSFTYISIIETLSFLCLNKSFLKWLFWERQEQDGIISDFQDGTYFKSNIFFQENKNSFLIQLYFDEFDPCDGIGAKKGIHKQGALYFVLRNLPPHFNSKIENIFLISLFYSTDLKIHDFSVILQPLINDLKKLEEHGITVQTELGPKIVKGTLAALSFDNLGGNTLLGLVETFSAHYCCRLCKIDRYRIKEYLEEDPIFLRTKKDLLECLNLSNITGEVAFGIKKVSLLNELKHFNSMEALTVDCMHDLPHGVCQVEVSEIIGVFIAEKLFTLDDLNKRILAYNYGFLESSNKPTVLTKNKEGKICTSFTSSQMLCFVKSLPLIIGHLITPELDKYWEIFLLLLDILDIVLSPRLNEFILQDLKLKVKEHHQKLLDCFPGLNLIPKHHFLIHYPSVGLLMGPFIFLWCMRFESKHKYFKSIVKKTMNFINLCKLLSERHQEDIMYKNYAKNFDVQFSPSKSHNIKLSELLHSKIISETLKIDLHTVMTTFKWVKRSSIQYRLGYFLFFEIDEFDDPLFLKITNFFEYEDKYYILGEIFKTVTYHKNLHSYSVATCGQYKVCELKNFCYVQPFEAHLNESVPSEVLLTPNVVLF